MKSIIQRVLNAKVVIEGETHAEIKRGILALTAFAITDNKKTIEFVFNKMLELRIFEDENNKMNLSALDNNYGILVVPNFTIYGDTLRGRRPSYSSSAPFETANKIFEYFKAYAKSRYNNVFFGIFGADMQVSLTNDGPVTLVIEKD
jgi:D-tyrosyl-tRNA(Tyr) deacylase